MADDEISVKNDLTYEPLKERLTCKQDLSFCKIFLETHRRLTQVMLCRINQREKDQNSFKIAHLSSSASRCS